MNMDLMIDCMPYNGFDDKLYEMLEDDMRIISNLNCSASSSSSPSCLSDEEQLALANCTNFDDFLCFSSHTSSAPSNATSTYSTNSLQLDAISGLSNNNYTSQSLDDPYASVLNLNNSFNSSQYSFQSSCSSSPFTSASASASSSSAPSPLSLSSSSSSLCAALASASFQSSSSSTSTCSSSLASPICLSPSQFNTTTLNNNSNNFQLDDFNSIGNGSSNTMSINASKYMQDSYLNNNYNLYQVINPLDINRTYANDTSTPTIIPTTNSTTSSSSPSSSPLSISQSHLLNTKTISLSSITNNNLQLPTLVTTTRPTQVSITKSNSNYSSNNSTIVNNHQQVKRGKFSHNINVNTNNNQGFILNPSGITLKQEPIMHSDGESIISNESDSNSNFSNSSSGALNTTQNSNNSNNNNNNNTNSNEFQAKKLIITTKLEPFYNLNSTNNSGAGNASQTNNSAVQLLNVNNTHINVIKITNPKDNDSKSSNGLQLPITGNKLSSDINSQNHKTIIQYKQLINNNNNNNNNTNTQTTTATVTTTAKQQTSVKSRQNAANSMAANSNANTQNGQVTQVAMRSDGKAYPKPPYSYSCLIAMALRNSDSGTLPVSDIYEFIIHNLSLNKCFEKIENPTNGSKKGCLWALNPDKCKKLEEECKRCRQRDPVNIRLSMSRPDDLNKIERGEQRIKKYTTQRKMIENGTINISNNSPIQQPNNTQLLGNDFLSEWNNKGSLASSITSIKDEENDHYFDDFGNSDIKFDQILLSAVNTTMRTNLQ